MPERDAASPLAEAEEQKRVADAKTVEAAANLVLANRRLTEANTARNAEPGAKRDAIAKAELARNTAARADRSAYFANMPG